MKREVWYRYYDSSLEIPVPYLSEIPVTRHTPKGVWLDQYGELKFVLKDARRRYAYPTIDLALDSFIQRKKKQIQHCENTINRAKAGLFHAEAMQRGETPKHNSPWFQFT